MRNMLILAGALGVLALAHAAHAADVDDPQYGTAGPAIDRANAAGVWADETELPQSLRVMGVLSEAEVQAMRAAHAAAGLTLNLTVVPAGGVNAGKFYVTSELTPELLAQMEAAHSGANLALDLRALPVDGGVVMGDTQVREHAAHDARGYTNATAAERKARREARRAAREALRGDWHGGPGWYGPHGEHGNHGKWRGKGKWRGARGWRGERGNYDLRDKCGHWEQDWHQDGCGVTHVHNLADWLPNHVGWSFGWPYGGRDDDYWPHVRNDGSHVWYTGEFWRTANIKVTPPAWYDAQWALFGDAYPDTWWLSTWQGHGWSWDGHGWGKHGKHRGGCGCNKCGGRWH